MDRQEKDNLMGMLRSMTQYLNDNNWKSIISRIYGVYQVKYPGMSSIFLMLQKNNLQIMPWNELYCKFDLKGSKYTRREIDP